SRTHATAPKMFSVLPHCTGPLSPATPDLNIWEANLSPSPERDKAGNQPLCRVPFSVLTFWSNCTSLFYSAVYVDRGQTHSEITFSQRD
uniref:Uncharacterized protein n=1 Tax=Seriola lalandi dorsalis TaxID=1841481 RepID=A0A3B4XTS1_SERLL